MGLINFESPDQLNNLSLNFSGARIAEVKKFSTIKGGIQGRMTGIPPRRQRKKIKPQNFKKRMKNFDV